MRDIALFDSGEGHDREDIDRAELRIDHGAIPEARPNPQIGLEQRRQGGKPLADIHRAFFEDRHRDGTPFLRKHIPFLASCRMMMQEAQWQGERQRICAGQARAADQHIDLMVLRIDPKAAPQKLDHALRAIVRMDAGAAEFEKSLVAMARQQRLDIEFALAVKALMTFRDIAAQKAIGANHSRLFSAEAIDRFRVDDEQMIAILIERAYIAPHQCASLGRNRFAFLVENLEPQALRLADFGALRREANLEGTRTSKNWR